MAERTQLSPEDQHCNSLLNFCQTNGWSSRDRAVFLDEIGELDGAIQVKLPRKTVMVRSGPLKSCSTRFAESRSQPTTFSVGTTPWHTIDLTEAIRQPADGWESTGASSSADLTRLSLRDFGPRQMQSSGKRFSAPHVNPKSIVSGLTVTEFGGAR
jgi:hypothetical protein